MPRRPAQPDPDDVTGSGLAWLVRTVTHVPGVLHLHGDRLRFVSTRGVLFDDTPSALALVPARTGRGGFRLTLGGEDVRLHVVRFSGAVDVAGDLQAREAARGLLTRGEPRAGAVWRRLIAAHDRPDSSPTDAGHGARAHGSVRRAHRRP